MMPLFRLFYSFFLPSIHCDIGCGVVNIWQRLCTAQKGDMPRRRKEQGSKEKTAFRLSSYSAVKPQAAKCIFIVVVRKSDCAPGKSGVMQSQSMPSRATDADACLPSCALWLATTTSLVKMCCFTQASFALSGIHQRCKMSRIWEQRSYIRHQC